MLATCRTLLGRCFLTAAAITSLASLAAAADKVDWRNDYDVARKDATERGKLLLLDFGTEDCVHCRRMHQTTFRDPAIMKLINERFIALKIDAHREPRLAQSLRIQAYPTMVLASDDGKILAWIEGYIEVNRLTEQLNRASALLTPDWMVRDHQEATRSISQGDYARAITLLKNIASDGKTRSVQTKAREQLQEIEMQAAGRLARARQMDEKGQTLEAIDLLTELSRKYAGAESAVEGGKLLATLNDKTKATERTRGRRAQELLASARDDFKNERFLACLDQCEVLAAAYADLAEGKEGERIAAEIKSNPDRMAKVCDSMNDRLAAMYVTQAEAWLKKGNYEQASVCLEKVLRISPTGAMASLAQARLAQIQNKTSDTPGME
jgi:thioredoxin-related protein